MLHSDILSLRHTVGLKLGLGLGMVLLRLRLGLGLGLGIVLQRLRLGLGVGLGINLSRNGKMSEWRGVPTHCSVIHLLTVNLPFSCSHT